MTGYFQQIDLIFSFCTYSMENQNDRTEKTNMENLLYFFFGGGGLKFHEITFFKDKFLTASFIRRSRSYLVGQSALVYFPHCLARNLA